MENKTTKTVVYELLTFHNSHTTPSLSQIIGGYIGGFMERLHGNEAANHNIPIQWEQASKATRSAEHNLYH